MLFLLFLVDIFVIMWIYGGDIMANREYYYSPKSGSRYKNEYKSYKGIEQKAGETSKQYYKRLAKAADQRLRRLEALSEQDKYKNVKQWAYKEAMYDIKALFGEGVNRFDTAVPKTKAGEIDERFYNARLNAVKRFLNAPTSSKGNIDILYGSRADTLNKRYGSNFNWQTVGKFFQSNQFKKLERIYGSKTAVKVAGALQRKGINLDKAIKEIDLRTVRSEKGAAKAIEKFEINTGISADDYMRDFTPVSDDELPF